jgi:aminoglycoside phosphotransferase family enzyme/adenylate kinase family enzyme
MTAYQFKSGAQHTVPKQSAQESLVAAMMQPGFYPKVPGEVSHKETHISHLFFAGELVYKIKKAIRFSFLDYSTLAQRRYFLNEELRLNRRLAPSVYLGVMPISLDESGWRLGGWTEPAEYTLVMRRLPERRMLPFLLQTLQVTPELMHELAEVLAKFHQQAERVSVVSRRGDYGQLIEKPWNDNFTDLEPLVGAVVEAETLRRLKEFGLSFFARYRDLLGRRAAQGWVRDVHGDLHCEHVCFAPEGVQIFDCIEFSNDLRRCDLASEIAFLLMDLEFRGGKALVKPFLARYRELLDVPDLPTLLPFFSCYRAIVRGKVHALRGRETDASRYLRFAARYTWAERKPFLVMVCGLTGSGKSTLARELGERLDMPVISSDAVRKALADKPGKHIVAYQTGIYSPAMTTTVYRQLARAAEQSIEEGSGAILDATFIERAKREKIARIAAKYNVPLFVVQCRASDETTETRLAQRAAEGKDLSDGRWEIYLKQKSACEPMDELAETNRLVLDTEQPINVLAMDCEKFFHARLAV